MSASGSDPGCHCPQISRDQVEVAFLLFEWASSAHRPCFPPGASSGRGQHANDHRGHALESPLGVLGVSFSPATPSRLEPSVRPLLSWPWFLTCLLEAGPCQFTQQVCVGHHRPLAPNT